MNECRQRLILALLNFDEVSNIDFPICQDTQNGGKREKRKENQFWFWLAKIKDKFEKKKKKKKEKDLLIRKKKLNFSKNKQTFLSSQYCRGKVIHSIWGEGRTNERTNRGISKNGLWGKKYYTSSKVLQYFSLQRVYHNTEEVQTLVDCIVVVTW